MGNEEEEGSGKEEVDKVSNEKKKEKVGNQEDNRKEENVGNEEEEEGNGKKRWAIERRMWAMRRVMVRKRWALGRRMWVMKRRAMERKRWALGRRRRRMWAMRIRKRAMGGKRWAMVRRRRRRKGRSKYMRQTTQEGRDITGWYRWDKQQRRISLQPEDR